MSDRQFAWALAFCNSERATFKNSVAAARKAGYPDPETAGDDMYDMYGQELAEFIKREDMMSQFIISGLVQMTQAMTTKHFANMGVIMDSEDIADNAARIAAWKELSSIYITKAATKNEVSGPGGAPLRFEVVTGIKRTPNDPLDEEDFLG